MVFIQEVSLPYNSVFVDCLEHLWAGSTVTGVYTIQPHDEEINVKCDMTTDGGGWTVSCSDWSDYLHVLICSDWSEYSHVLV